MSRTNPKQPKRPYIVRARAPRWRAGVRTFGRWYTEGTYVTAESALRKQDGLKAHGYEVRTFHRDLLAEMKDLEIRESLPAELRSAAA